MAISRESWAYAAFLLVAFSLGFLLIREHAQALILQDKLLAASASVATFGDANERLANKLEDCETTRAAIQKTANACGEGWAVCEKRWGETGWR